MEMRIIEKTILVKAKKCDLHFAVCSLQNNIIHCVWVEEGASSDRGRMKLLQRSTLPLVDVIDLKKEQEISSA